MTMLTKLELARRAAVAGAGERAYEPLNVGGETCGA